MLAKSKCRREGRPGFPLWAGSSWEAFLSPVSLDCVFTLYVGIQDDFRENTDVLKVFRSEPSEMITLV